MSLREYYKTLELSESADLAELNEQYRNKIKRFHPDLFADDPAKQRDADEKTKKINRAYSELKKILPKNPAKKTTKNDAEERIPENRDSLNEFDILGFISNLFSKLMKKSESRSTIKTGSSEDNSKKNPQRRSQFSEVLKNKMDTANQRKMSLTSYSKTYKEMQKKRALYGNRQKDGANEKGPISPVSAVQDIRNNRIQ